MRPSCPLTPGPTPREGAANQPLAARSPLWRGACAWRQLEPHPCGAALGAGSRASRCGSEVTCSPARVATSTSPHSTAQPLSRGFSFVCRSAPPCPGVRPGSSSPVHSERALVDLWRGPTAARRAGRGHFSRSAPRRRVEGSSWLHAADMVLASRLHAAPGPICELSQRSRLVFAAPPCPPARRWTWAPLLVGGTVGTRSMDSSTSGHSGCLSSPELRYALGRAPPPW